MKLISKIILLTVIAALLIWDFIALMFGGAKTTVSAVIIAWTRKWPAIPLLFGFVAGHLFF